MWQVPGNGDGVGRQKEVNRKQEWLIIYSWVLRRDRSTAALEVIPWVQLIRIRSFQVVRSRRRLRPFPRPGYIVGLLVGSPGVLRPGVLLRLWAPVGILPLVVLFSTVLRVRMGSVMSTPKPSVCILWWCHGPPLWLRWPLGNPRFHLWLFDFCSWVLRMLGS